MKKLSIFSVLFIGLFFAFSVCAQEKIDDFAATIKINTDSSINVSERIEYDFGTQEKHGIFRFIPIKYKARGGNYNLRISDISVNDENNFAYPFKKSPSGNSIEIKIGDADKLISGKKIYTINYKINRAINYFDDYDELYWNVTGNEWGILIEKSFAKIILPIPLKPEEIKKECFAGDFSSVDKCSAIQFGNNNDNGLINSVNFSETKSLNPGEGLTIVVGWPKDIVAKPSTTQNISYIIKDNLILAFPLIVFFILFYVWFRLGRDPRGRGTIIAQYEAPDSLTPAEIGTIIDEKVDDKDISSEIVHLATKGYLKITRLENKGIIFKSEDYQLDKLKMEGNLSSTDKRLMEGLFSSSKTSVKLSELKNKFYKDLLDIKDYTYKTGVEKGYFAKNPKNTKTLFIILGLFVGMISLVIGGILSGFLGPFVFLSAGISAAIVIIFATIMPKKTLKGVYVKEKILGLKEYLKVAEKDRIKFHNAPAKNPQHFETLLPYAMVLGVEKEWAKQFEGIYNQPPSWYSDQSGGTFNSLILIHSLSNFNQSANAAIASHPGSAAGGSGFGGGGFSGGGFGGGGGGSW